MYYIKSIHGLSLLGILVITVVTVAIHGLQSDTTALTKAVDANTVCQPLVCPTGERHPRCSADGSAIQYFRDPCQQFAPTPTAVKPATTN